ncbi:MAG: CPBP family intramembrane glutamic endopeptidase [Phycisphaeraceae bacterium]
MAEPVNFLLVLPWLLGWALTLVWFWRRGVIGPRARLVASAGPISPLDGLVAILLVIGGSTAFGLVVQQLGLNAESSSDLTKALLIPAGQFAFLGIAGLYGLVVMMQGAKHTAPTIHHLVLITAGGCVATITLGQGTVVVIAWIGSLLGFEAPTIAHKGLVEIIAASDPLVLTIRLASALLLAPVFEELVFRGIIQRAIHSAIGSIWPTLILTSLFFGLVHASLVPLQGLPGLVVLGVIFGWLYARTGRLWVAIVAHVVFNAFNVAMAFIFYAASVPPAS